MRKVGPDEAEAVMTTKAFDKIAAGLRAAVDFAEGRVDEAIYRVHVPSEIDVRALRGRLGLTQAEFASRYAFSPARIRDWEQGRSRPDGAVRAYLMVIDRQPAAVDLALRPEWQGRRAAKAVSPPGRRKKPADTKNRLLASGI